MDKAVLVFCSFIGCLDVAVNFYGIVEIVQVSAYESFARMNGIDPTVEKQRRRMDLTTSEPQFTNCTRDFLGTLDYIFYTGEIILFLSHTR